MKFSKYVMISIVTGIAGMSYSADQPTRFASPYWGNNTSSQPSESTGSSPLGNLPAADIRAVPPAKAQAVHAWWSYDQAIINLNNAIRIKFMQLESQDTFLSAIKEEKDAWSQVESIRSKVLSGLHEEPGYMANDDLRKKLAEQIQDEYQKEHPDTASIAAMSHLKLGYAGNNRKLETALLERDTDYKSAITRLQNATDHLRDLRAKNAVAIASDDELRQLRERLADLKIEKLTAAAYLDSVINSREIALDYAYNYINSQNRNRYGYSYGYNYGYSTGGGYNRY